jgi:lipid-A-disaccharide synthase-like uncharacterized protein
MSEMEGLGVYWIYAIGFLSQGLFAARLIIQWLMSEKEGRIVSPAIYWHITLVATYLFIIYGILQHDVVIIFGMVLSYIISVRNLQLDGAWQEMPLALRAIAIVLPLITILYLFLPHASFKAEYATQLIGHVWMLIGAVGQTLLNVRFIYQWYYAEKLRTSILPVGFWYMTAVGSIMVVVYALYRFDPVLLFAQGLGLFASVRNIQLHFKTKEVN